MTEQVETWTLPSGITLTISEPDESGWENFSFGEKKNLRWLDADDFRELFVPVSEQKQQLRELLAKEIDTSLLGVSEAYIDDLTNRVLAVVGLSNTPGSDDV